VRAVPPASEKLLQSLREPGDKVRDSGCLGKDWNVEMGQIRGQTRNGAPPPATVEQFSAAIQNSNINNPSRRPRNRQHVSSESEISPPALPQEDEQSSHSELPDDNQSNTSSNHDDGGTSRPSRAPDVARTLTDVFWQCPMFCGRWCPISPAWTFPT
jgi:hypothetical protein